MSLTNQQGYPCNPINPNSQPLMQFESEEGRRECFGRQGIYRGKGVTRGSEGLQEVTRNELRTRKSLQRTSARCLTSEGETIRCGCSFDALPTPRTEVGIQAIGKAIRYSDSNGEA